LPGFLTGTKPHPSRSASKGPKMKPLASGPTMTSGSHSSCWRSLTNRSVMEDNRPGAARTGVMSRNWIPSIGKSGTVLTVSRILSRSSSAVIPTPEVRTFAPDCSGANVPVCVFNLRGLRGWPRRLCLLRDQCRTSSSVRTATT